MVFWFSLKPRTSIPTNLVGNKGTPPLLVADPSHLLCDHNLNHTISLRLDMPTVDRSPYHPEGEEAVSHFYPGDDFELWRARFQALCRQRRWSDDVAKPFAFAYMAELAAEAVMDIPYDGSESLDKFLDAYRDRLQLYEHLRILHLSEEELAQDLRCQGPSVVRRRNRRLRPAHSLRVPARRLSREEHRGLIFQVETPGGQLEEVALPPDFDLGEIQKRIRAERRRHLLREAEDGTPAPSSEAIRNRLLFEHTRPRPRPDDLSRPNRQDSGYPAESIGDSDFPSGQ